MCCEYNVPEIQEIEEDIDMGIYQDQRPCNSQRDNQDLMLGRQQRSKIVQLLQNRILHV